MPPVFVMGVRLDGMLGTTFTKDRVNSDTLRPGDCFGMDLNRNNFQNWRDRLPLHAPDHSPLTETCADLIESFELEFEPDKQTSGCCCLKETEVAAVERFHNQTLPSLKQMMGFDGEEDWSGQRVSVSGSGYQYSLAQSKLLLDERNNHYVQSRVIVARHMVAVSEGEGSDPVWLLPAISAYAVSEGESAGYVLEPEEFSAGPFCYVHVLHSLSTEPDQMQEVISPRFSSAAFQEAIEHFVGKHAGVPGLTARYSIVDELLTNELSRHHERNVEIDEIRLVENRFESSAFHFSLILSDGDQSWQEDAVVFLLATGRIAIELSE